MEIVCGLGTIRIQLTPEDHARAVAEKFGVPTVPVDALSNYEQDSGNTFADLDLSKVFPE